MYNNESLGKHIVIIVCYHDILSNLKHTVNLIG